MSPLLDRLERHYIKPGAPLPGGIFLREVGWNGRAVAGGCDAIYVGFTSTSGRLLVGHELKVSRSDWLRELNSPGKADGWADECHQWWLVVSDPQIVKEGELPAGWGLMSPGRSVTRMDVHVKAERKPPTHQPSWQAVRSIMARQDTLRSAAIAAARRKVEDAVRAEIEDKVNERLGQKLRDLEANGANAQTNLRRLQQLQTALGVYIEWDDERPTYGTRVKLPEVEEVAEVLRQVHSVKAAVTRLTNGMNTRNLEQIERQARDLAKLLNGVKSDAPTAF